MTDVPAYMKLEVVVMSGDPEAMLFHALQQISYDWAFHLLPNGAKARCAQHVADMLLSRPDAYHVLHSADATGEVETKGAAA